MQVRLAVIFPFFLLLLVFQGYFYAHAGDDPASDYRDHEDYPISSKLDAIHFKINWWNLVFIHRYNDLMNALIRENQGQTLDNIQRFYQALLDFLEKVNQKITLRDIEVAHDELREKFRQEFELLLKKQPVLSDMLKQVLDELPWHKISKDLAQAEISFEGAISDSQGVVEASSSTEVYDERWHFRAQSLASLLCFPEWRVKDIDDARKSERWDLEPGFKALKYQIESRRLQLR